MAKLLKRYLGLSYIVFCTVTYAGYPPGDVSSSIGCPDATLTAANFCEAFKAATECHCLSAGVRKEVCARMNLVYKTMVGAYGTLQRVCASQHHTSSQECIDDWNCYRYGGLTSDGQLCGGTGHGCD